MTRLLVLLLLTSTAGAEPVPASTKKALKRVVAAACEQALQTGAPPEARAARIGKIVRTETLSEHAARPYLRVYLTLADLVGWEAWFQSSTLEVHIPPRVHLTIGQLESLFGGAEPTRDHYSAGEMRDAINGRDGAAIDRPPTDFDIAHLGRAKSCILSLHGDGTNREFHLQRVLAFEVLD